MAQAPYAAPPPQQGNAAGMIGFILSLVGLVFGVTAPIGAVVSLIGLRNEPKGLAIAGTIIGLVLTVIWGAIWFLVGSTILACVGIGQAFGSAAQNSMSMNEAKVVISQRQSQDGELPTAAVGNNLIGHLEDSWGNKLRYEPDDDGRGYVIRSAGADGQFNTVDDLEERGSTVFGLPADDGSMIDAGPDGGLDADDPGDAGNDGPGDDGG